MAKKTKKKVASRKTGKKRVAASRKTATKRKKTTIRASAKKTSKPVTKRTAVKKAVKKISKSTTKRADIAKPGMMGDGTEEQNLNQQGDPSARITKDEVDAAFKKPD